MMKRTFPLLVIILTLALLGTTALSVQASGNLANYITPTPGPDGRIIFIVQPDQNCTMIANITDSINSHKQFGEKNSLPFTLLSDHEKRVSQLYDAIAFLGISQRAYVLIDETGTVRLSFNDFLPLFYQSTRDLLAKIDAMKPE